MLQGDTTQATHPAFQENMIIRFYVFKFFIYKQEAGTRNAALGTRYVSLFLQAW